MTGGAYWCYHRLHDILVCAYRKAAIIITGNSPYLMQLGSLMSTYAPVYPHGAIWQETFTYLMNDPTEAAIVNELMRQLAKDGTFREPVTLETAESRDEDDPVTPDNPLTVMNGTHRVCATYLSGKEEILVEDYHRGSAEYDGLCGTTEIALKDSVHIADDMFDVMRSLPLSDDVWVTSSIMSGHQGYMTIMWDFPINDETRGWFDAITERVIAILVEAGISASDVHVHTEVEDLSA